MGYHAKTHGWTGTKTYKVWSSMKERCLNKDHKNFANYGGRGIAVCERWQTFENFLADMGPAPERMSLDRKDNDAGYSPENCRWATQLTQANNRSSNHPVTAFGETKTRAEWLRDPRCRTTRFPLFVRLKRGMRPEEAITKPNGPAPVRTCRPTAKARA